MERNKLPPIAQEALQTIFMLREYHRMYLSGSALYCSSINSTLTIFSQELEERIAEKHPHLANLVKREARQLLLTEPLKEISSEYRLMMCLQKYCGYVEPLEMILGMEFKAVYGDDHEEIREIPIKAMYVPMVQQLTKLFKNNEVRDLCFSKSVQESNDENMIKSVKDGSVYKNHPICQLYPDCLLLQLYEDDVELVNPLGSHTKTHKVTLVYWTILNMPEHVRSNLKSFNLQGVALASSIKKFGFQNLLSDFLNCVKILESSAGLNLELENGEILNLHGTLISVNGDGLALNGLGGFKEGIGFAEKPCRNCDNSKEEIRTIFVETNLRDITSHRERVSELENDYLTKKDRDQLSKEYGITGDSVLSQLVTFDLTKCLPQDSMHNILEGVEEVELRALIFELIEKRKILTYEKLNYLIAGFPYPKTFLNCKPSRIEKIHIMNGKLRQNASQMLTLMFIMPFVLESYACGEAYEHVANFSLLSQISNVIFSYEVDRSSLSLVRYMIWCHHTKFIELYPDISPTPKFHFLVHTPSVIEQFGPIRVSWTMRYEALNAWASRVGEDTRNFKNIPKTLATRFQVKNCIDFGFGDAGTKILGERTFSAVDCQKINISDYRLGKEVYQEFGTETNNDNEVFACKKVYVQNFDIEIDSYLLISNPRNDFPVFGQLKAVFVCGNVCVFVLQMNETKKFNKITNAYEVCETNRFACMSHTKMSFLNPLPCVRLGGKISIILQFNSRCEFQGC